MIQAENRQPESSIIPVPSPFRKTAFYTPPDIIDQESCQPILRDLLLVWTGCYTRAVGHRVDNRLLQDHVLIYCVEGRGWLELAGQRRTIGRGDLFCCPPGIPHSYGADSVTPWTKYYVHFRGSQAAAYMAQLGLTPDSPVIRVGENQRIIAWLHEIFGILHTGYSHDNLLLATAVLGHMLSYLCQLTHHNSLNPATGMPVGQVVAYMLDHIDGNLTLEQLARFAGLSKYHFARQFKIKTGYAPIDYFIRLKMHKACELLETNAAKISDIGVCLGFGNPYFFSNTFKRIVGQSPQHYRQMVQYGPLTP